MQKIIFLFAFISVLSLSSCSKKSINKGDLPPDVQLQVNAGDFLDAWHDAAAQSDFDAYFDVIAENGVYVGTDATEVWTKEEFSAFSKPYFDKGQAWDFDSIERNLYLSDNNNYIWFDETLDTWMGICRGSGVLQVLPEGKFAIRHYVLSLTVPNAQIQEVIKVIGTE